MLTRRRTGMHNRRSYDSIQYLRAYAALIVASNHAGLLDAGYFGVDLFFVISGFVMATLMDDITADAKSFFVSRFTRVAPIYYLFTAVALLLNQAIPVPILVPSDQITVSRILESVLFVNFAHEGPVYGVGWTLNFEFMFYVVCGIVIAFEKETLPRILVTALGTAFVSLVGFIFLPKHQYAVLLEFVMGLGVYVLCVKLYPRVALPSWAVFAVGTVGAATPWIIITERMMPHWPFSFARVTALGIPSAVLLAVCVWREQTHDIPRIPILRKLGDASYSIYLTHCIIVGLGAYVFTLGLPRPLVAAALVCVVALVSWPVHRWIERPIISATRLLFSSRKPKALGPQREAVSARDSSSTNASDHISYPASDR